MRAGLEAPAAQCPEAGSGLGRSGAAGWKPAAPGHLSSDGAVHTESEERLEVMKVVAGGRQQQLAGCSTTD